VEVNVVLLSRYLGGVKRGPEACGADAKTERGQDAGDSVVRVGNDTHRDSKGTGLLLMLMLFEGTEERDHAGGESVALVRGEAVQKFGTQIPGYIPIRANEWLESLMNHLSTR
jgi:hypothetical protein